MRPYIIVWGPIISGGIRSDAQIIPSRRYIIHVGRNETNNPVHVIGHNDERIQNDLAPQFLRPFPFRHHDSTVCVQVHSAALHLPEETLPVVRTDCHKVRSGRSIIE